MWNNCFWSILISFTKMSLFGHFYCLSVVLLYHIVSSMTLYRHSFGLWQYTDIFLFPIYSDSLVYEIIWTIVAGTIFECSLWSLKFGHCFRLLRLLNTPTACAIYLDTLFIYKNTWHMLSLVLSDKLCGMVCGSSFRSLYSMTLF